MTNLSVYLISLFVLANFLLLGLILYFTADDDDYDGIA